MNHGHRKILHSLFAHPIPSNLHLADVERVLRDLGAEVGHSGHGRFTATLAGQHISLHGGNHGLSKDEVAQVRRALEAAGVAPADFPV
ncbi:hypothetical protein [Rubellimicrobium aerolatum]|uniref:Type II toxin-antitoxin system HicA family toxin n=1 Tax=Rubellimicrobium aerolatum TaxID=490979 RepID=A0ABW0SDA7_9RHOB|nr:hypothetical protein [Rubellimicrobium aerolatum]MBP1806716.1 hypothetical protein [Rubellimicrobium aerolatum]